MSLIGWALREKPASMVMARRLVRSWGPGILQSSCLGFTTPRKLGWEEPSASTQRDLSLNPAESGSSRWAAVVGESRNMGGGWWREPPKGGGREGEEWDAPWPRAPFDPSGAGISLPLAHPRQGWGIMAAAALQPTPNSAQKVLAVCVEGGGR